MGEEEVVEVEKEAEEEAEEEEGERAEIFFSAQVETRRGKALNLTPPVSGLLFGPACWSVTRPTAPLPPDRRHGPPPSRRPSGGRGDG